MSEKNNYANTRADEVQKLFHGLGVRKHAAAIASIVKMEIEDALQIECEKCAEKDKHIAESADGLLRLIPVLEEGVISGFDVRKKGKLKSGLEARDIC